MQIGDEDFVRHDRRCAEHLGAANGDAGRILVDDARDQILRLFAPGLAALGLRIDDDVGQEQIALAGIIEIIGERLGALGAVLAKDIEAHALPDQSRGQMVRRTAEKAAGQRRPGLQRFAPLHHLVVAARHLPGAVDAPVRAVRLEGHEFEIVRMRLEVVERGGGAHRVAERGMRGDVADRLAVEKDGAAVLERLDVLGSGFAIAHGSRPSVPSLGRRQVRPSVPLMSCAASPPTRWFGRPRLA